MRRRSLLVNSDLYLFGGVGGYSAFSDAGTVKLIKIFTTIKRQIVGKITKNNTIDRSNCLVILKDNKRKIAIGLLATAAIAALGLAFGLHNTRPAMIHFFTKMIPNAFHKGMVAPLVTAALGGVVLGASIVTTIAACKSRRSLICHINPVRYQSAYGKIA